MKVIIIGGGPAGIIAALQASKYAEKVIILEKMETIGKKLLITGKGRCNITSSLPMEKFIENTPGNGRFLYSSFNSFTNKNIIELLEAEGVKVKEERGNRIFPVTDSSKDVLQAFLRMLKKSNVEIKTKTKVSKILEENGKVIGVISENKEKFYAEKIIIATGGRSYPVTGSTGDGYSMAKELGHTITKIRPSLIPLTVSKKYLDLCKKLQGLSLVNVKIELKDKLTNKIIYSDFGEMLFTHWGVSGPIILSASAHLLRYKNIDKLLSEEKIELIINLKPALDEEKLSKRIFRDFEKQKNKDFKNSLDELLPKKLIEPIIELSQINENKKVNSITKEERIRLVRLLQNFTIIINGFRPIEEAIITSGGISIKEIDPKTMESKIIKGLFFAGEVIDVDAYTGGFNLQIAYSTGFVAGNDYKVNERLKI